MSKFLLGSGSSVPGLEASVYANFVHVWFVGKHWAISDQYSTDK